MPTDRPTLVRVSGVPSWVDAARLLGPTFAVEDDVWQASLPREAAADVAARLRKVGLGGALLSVQLRPRLKRTEDRAARTRDARARRETSPGWDKTGVQTDEEGRWSLTPYKLAAALGRKARALAVDPVHVLDLGCGSGGNTVGFARNGCRVTAIERDAQRARQCTHNLTVYGLASQAHVQTGDARALTLPPADLWWIDPPWGTDWDRTCTRLADLPDLTYWRDRARAEGQRLWAKVPPSFDPTSTPDATASAWFGHAPGDRHRVKFVVLTWAFEAP